MERVRRRGGQNKENKRERETNTNTANIIHIYIIQHRQVLRVDTGLVRGRDPCSMEVWRPAER